MDNADFSGYATKADLKCSDGRTITREAFQNMDGVKVPLVWQHGHNEPNNVLGHALLKKVEDGVRAYAFFNDTPQGKTAKKLVQHGDITMLSIYANQLIERGKQVFHGVIREVSLVLSGANPGALIDQVAVAHSDDPEDVTILSDEAVIYTGIPLEHSGDATKVPLDEVDSSVEHSAEDPTMQEIFDGMTDVQKDFVAYVAAEAAKEAVAASVEHSDDSADEADKADEAVQHSDDEKPSDNSETPDDEKSDDNSEDNLTHQEGNESMDHNVFENNGTVTKTAEGSVLSHSDLKTIIEDAQRVGSLKEAVESYALAHSITDIDILFPDAKQVGDNPELIARRADWVTKVIDGAKHSPFARIKSVVADLTAEEARAKGYVKGNLKKEEIVRLLKRVTTPTTVYKKQKLDRDDIVDITTIDVVAWLKWEMRFMLQEELARAILVGDGREPDDDDKINEDNVRPIAWDNEMYAHPVTVPANVSPDALIESVIRARKYYKGTGTPSFFTSDDIITDMLLVKDRMGRRVYNTEAELAATLRVKELVPVEVMEDTPDLLGVMVNMADYTIGADKGGEVNMFDDFDIDYNQYKYLIETRISGALTKPKAAVVVKRTSGTTVNPTVPTFVQATNTITIPTVTGVTYYDASDDSVLTGDVVITETTDVEARPNTGYNFPHNTDADWTFAYVAP